MVAYNHPNQPHHLKSNGKVIGGAIIMILGIIIFFCAVFVPIMFDNIFLMFPFFFGGFIIIIIGVVTLMIGLKNRSIESGIAPKSRIMGRYMNWANKLSGNKNQINFNQNHSDQYGQPNNKTNPAIDSRKQGKNTRRKKREIICSYCGTSNNLDNEFCVGCNSKLET
jgi:hypothetical protein